MKLMRHGRMQQTEDFQREEGLGVEGRDQPKSL